MKQTQNPQNLIKSDIDLLNTHNADYIIGIDEVGRGCLAGPIVGCAFLTSKKNLRNINPDDQYANQITDSKKLNKKSRETLNPYIQQNCTTYSIHECDNVFIDKYGIQKANIKVMVDALNDCISKLSEGGNISQTKILVITDHLDLQKHTKDKTNLFFLNPDKADSISYSVACASILAKTFRDDLMINKIHIKYPHYAFDKNVGYGTKTHIEAIKTHGICDVHRKSFSIKSIRV